MQVVGDRYRLDAELGTGGTATVWRAHDLVLDRPCAVKVLLPDERGGTTRRERLRAEARALGRLDHPNVVRVYDQGEQADRDYIVMEYLDSGSLADRVARDGPYGPAEAVRLILQVLSALGAAHEAGIVHRDVKPGNVLLRADGRVALADFGIARAGAIGTETRTGVALGSVGYMAPEQRIDARRVGPTADLYATACTLFNLVTDDTPVDLYLAPDHSPRWEAVPAALRAVLRRATRAEPDQRFQTAEEMARALEAVLPALEGVPAARSRRVETPIGYVPTKVDGPPVISTRARDPALDIEDWGWASRRSPVGRTALWVGLGLVVAVTAIGLSSGPVGEALERAGGLASLRPVDPAAPLPVLAGRWQGTFDGNPGTVWLQGTPESLGGRIEMWVGHHELRYTVVGVYQPAIRRLELQEASGVPGPARTWRGALSPSGLVIEGEMSLPGDPPMPFALVRLE